MGILEMSAREYERKKLELDTTIEKKKSELLIINEKIHKQEDLINSQKGEIENLKSEINSLKEKAGKDLEQFSKDLSDIKVNIEKESNIESIEWRSPIKKRRRLYGS